MEACICVDVDECVELLDDKIVKGRKEYKCEECNQTIKKGEKHEYHHGRFGGKFVTYRTCLPCMGIRKTYMNCGWHYGHVMEDIAEEWGCSTDLLIGDTKEDDDEY